MEHKLRLIPALILAAGMGACGGGDGGGGGDEPGADNGGNPPTQPAPEPGSLSAEDELRYLAGALDAHIVTAGIIRALRNQYDSTAGTTRTVNCDSGSATFDGTQASSSPDDRPDGLMTVEYDGCQIGDRILSGSASTDASLPAQDPEIYNMDLTLDGVQLTATNAELLSFSGDETALAGGLRASINGTEVFRDGRQPTFITVEWLPDTGEGRLANPGSGLSIGYSGTDITVTETAPNLDFPVVFSEAAAIPSAPTSSRLNAQKFDGSNTFVTVSVTSDPSGAGTSRANNDFTGSTSSFAFNWTDIWPSRFLYSRNGVSNPAQPPSTPPSEPEQPDDGTPDSTPNPPGTDDTIARMQGLWELCVGNFLEVLEIESQRFTSVVIEFEEEQCGGAQLTSFSDTAEFDIGGQSTTSGGLTAEDIDFTIIDGSNGFFNNGDRFFNIIFVNDQEMVFGDLGPFSIETEPDRPDSLSFALTYLKSTGASARSTPKKRNSVASSSGNARNRWLRQRERLSGGR